MQKSPEAALQEEPSPQAEDPQRKRSRKEIEAALHKAAERNHNIQDTNSPQTRPLQHKSTRLKKDFRGT